MSNTDPPFLLRFALGSSSCMLPVTIVNPIEVVKTRLQLQGELDLLNSNKKYKGLFHGFAQIFREEKLRGLYKGFTPSVLREAFYAGLRLALYEPLKELLGENRSNGTELSFFQKLIAGSLAGGIGAAIANPTDLVKIRMQADSSNQFPRYKNTFHAFYMIVKQEGILGLYKGTIPTTQRALIISAAMMPTYDHMKQFLIKNGILGENISAHIVAGMVAGFTMAFVTSPVDVVKTRLMNQKELKYSGMIDCFMKTLKTEGLLGLYKGLVPNWARLGPHTVMAMTLFEQFRKLAGIVPMIGYSGDGSINIYGNSLVLPNNANAYVNNTNILTILDAARTNTIFVPSLFSSNLDAQAYQYIATDNIYDVEHFQIQSDHFLAIGGFWSSVRILKWNPSSLRFEDFQTFPELTSVSLSNFITDWEFFTIGNRSFLAYSRYLSNSVNAVLEWNDNLNRFVYFQNFTINTISYGWKFWDTGSDQFLLWSLYGFGTTRVYRWNGNNFALLTTLATVAPISYTTFYNFLDGRYYLAVANERIGSAFEIPTGVQIFRYSGSNQFTSYQNITAKGAKSVRGFGVGGVYMFLAVAEATDNATRVDIDSSIYSWDGISNLYLFFLFHSFFNFLNNETFKPFQNIPTSTASAWQHYPLDPENYLVVANANSVNSGGFNIKSKIYRFSGSVFAEVGEISTTGASCLSLFSIDYHYFLFIGFKSNSQTSLLNSVIYQLNP